MNAAPEELSELEPEGYLRHVLECIVEYPVIRTAELLPWRIPGLRLRLDQRIAA